jgi:hypothetical protein
MNVAYLACSGWVAAALSSAARLRIADHLVAGPQSVESLAATTGTDPRVLSRVLRALVVFEVFAEDSDGRFVNTEASLDLITDRPGSTRAFCELAGGIYQRIFADIDHALQTGEPATWKTYGGSLYAHMEQDADDADVYDRGMEDLARSVGPALRKSRAWEGVHTIIDVGGGRGTVVKGILAGLPDVHGIVLDRASVCERAATELARADAAMAARLEFRPGDFFAFVPAGGDVYLLKNVLHNWNDESAVRLLRAIKIAVAATPGARLLVLEPPVKGTLPDKYQRLDDLMQVVICEPGTVARSVDELSTLLTSAAFTVTTTSMLKTGHAVIEAC